MIDCNCLLCLVPADGEMFYFIESSYPREKGDQAYLETKVIPSFYNCLTFSFHMYGKNTGKLNVYSQRSKDRKILRMSFFGDHGNQWHRARVPIIDNYPYKVSFVLFVSKNKNYQRRDNT